MSSENGGALVENAKYYFGVAESSGKEAGKKHLTFSDCKKCPPKRAKNITARIAEY